MKSVSVLGLLLLLNYTQREVQEQKIDSAANFRGLSVVNDQVAWLSGTAGTVGRTTDGGTTWQVIQVPGAEKIDFRDIEAFSETKATVLSIGPGEQSRIYQTINAGKTWKLQFQNADKDAFYDAIAFWDETHGIALSDPVKGNYRLLFTDDGLNWKPLEPKSMPAALPGEGAFAASGTCLITVGQSDVYFVTGGAKVARVFHSSDRGQHWTATETPIRCGKESQGIFSISMNGQQGMIVGGDYAKPEETEATAALTDDGGKTWKLVEQKLPFLSAISHSKKGWVAGGTTGLFHSTDRVTWKRLGQQNINAERPGEKKGWAVGPKGGLWVVQWPE